MGITTFQEALELTKKNIYRKKNYDHKLIDLQVAKDNFALKFNTQTKYIAHPVTKNAEHVLNRLVIKKNLYNGGEFKIKTINGVEGDYEEPDKKAFIYKTIIGNGVATLEEPATNKIAKYNTTITYNQSLWKNFKINEGISSLLEKKIDLVNGEIDDLIDIEKKIDDMAFLYKKLAFNYQLYNILNEYINIEGVYQDALNANIGEAGGSSVESSYDYSGIEEKVLKLFYGENLVSQNILSDIASKVNFYLRTIQDNIDLYSNELKKVFDDQLTLDNIITEPFNINEMVLNIELDKVVKFILENNFEIKKKKNDIKKLDINKEEINNDRLPVVNMELTVNSDKKIQNTSVLSVYYDQQNTLNYQVRLKSFDEKKKNRADELKTLENDIIKEKRKELLNLTRAKRDIDRLKDIIKKNSGTNINPTAIKAEDTIIQLILKYELSCKIFKYQVYLHNLKKLYPLEMTEEEIDPETGEILSEGALIDPFADFTPLDIYSQLFNRDAGLRIKK